MRVVVNGLAALKPKTGVGHHVANLAAALAAGYPADSFALYPGDRLARVVTRLNRPASGGRQSAGSAPHNRRTDVRRSPRLIGSIKAAAKAAAGWHFAAYTRAFRFDLYHEPNFIPFRSSLPTVVTVHDLSVVKFPQWHPADRVRLHDARFRRSLSDAAHVVVVSEAVRREVLAYAGLPPDRVTAIPNGIDRRFRPLPAEEVATVRERLGLPPRYFLCVGTIEPRKNIGTAVRAFADLPADVRRSCPLVLAGPWGWRSDADRELFDSVGAAAGVRHLGYVADVDLPAVYAGAVALVYPSHYEGFGLPPVEMMAAGGAVVASTADAVREVCGPHAELIDPADVAGWRAALSRLATDREYADHLRRGGVEYARRFTWERAAAATHAVYRRVLGITSAGPAAEQEDDRHGVEQAVQRDRGE